MSTATPPICLPKDLEGDEEEFRNLISTLPRQRWYGSTYFHKYKGFWLTSVRLAGLIACQRHFQAQDTDVLLITAPKSGTTWLNAIIFTLLHRNQYPIAQPDHPLLTSNPHFLVPALELLNYSEEGSLDFSPTSKSSLRLYSSHSPLTLLPNSVQDSASKIVYLCRNPKDVFVSYWHFSKKCGLAAGTSMEDFFEMFCMGVSFCGPFWDHVLSYWRESLEKPHKVFFLKYEELKEQPNLHLKRLADFLGCTITPEEETSKAIDEILRLSSFDNLRNLEVNKNGKALFGQKNEIFFRKGEVGDWKNYLTIEMADRIDQITLQKLHGSGLKF